MSEEKKLHQKTVLCVTVTREQRERLRGLVKKKKFKNESEAVQKALDGLLAST